MARYDRIGRGYNWTRTADIRVVSMLRTLLDLPTGTILADIGAGTGNYSNAMAALGYGIKAIEPSAEMRGQATANEDVEFLAGAAEAIPLASGSVDGVFSTLALHHFSSLRAAAGEMHRICPFGPIVLFTNDPRNGERFWLDEYFPEIFQRMHGSYPPIDEIARLVASVGGWEPTMHPFPLPSDFSDMNMRAGWNRPETYLDAKARQSMSGFALAPEAEVREGVERLREDLDSGRWEKKHGYLRKRESMDLGFVFLKFQRPARD